MPTPNQEKKCLQLLRQGSKPPVNTLKLMGDERGRGEMWEREAMGLRSLCRCRCGQGIHVARTIKTLINDRMISEVKRVSIAASRSELSEPFPVAHKENKQEAAAAEERAAAAAAEAREVMRRARAKEEIERKREAEDEERQQTRKEKQARKEKEKLEKVEARAQEKQNKQAARKERLASREAEFVEAAAAKEAAAAWVQRVWRGASVRIAAKAGDRAEILKTAMEKILRNVANQVGEADVADVTDVAEANYADQMGESGRENDGADTEGGGNAARAEAANERSLRRHAEVDADTVAEIEQTLLNYQFSGDDSPLYFPCGFNPAQRAAVHALAAKFGLMHTNVTLGSGISRLSVCVTPSKSAPEPEPEPEPVPSDDAPLINNEARLAVSDDGAAHVLGSARSRSSRLTATCSASSLARTGPTSSTSKRRAVPC